MHSTMNTLFPVLNRTLTLERVLILLASVLFTASLVTGCSRTKSPLVGKWKADTGAVIEFRSDGTCTLGTGKYPAPGKYTAISNTIMIQLDGDVTKGMGAAEWQMALTNDVLYITSPDALGRATVIPFKRMD